VNGDGNVDTVEKERLCCFAALIGIWASIFQYSYLPVLSRHGHLELCYLVPSFDELESYKYDVKQFDTHLF